MKLAMLAAVAVALPAVAGERAVVPGWQWVTIERCPTVVGECRRGDRCGIQIGGVVSEIGRHGGRVLVRYSERGGDVGGSACDGGEVFWLDDADIATMTERYKGVIQRAIENSNVVDRLLYEEDAHDR